jgi:hypothetical protein
MNTQCPFLNPRFHIMAFETPYALSTSRAEGAVQSGLENQILQAVSAEVLNCVSCGSTFYAGLWEISCGQALEWLPSLYATCGYIH